MYCCAERLWGQDFPYLALFLLTEGPMGSPRELFDWVITNFLSDVIKKNKGNEEGELEGGREG